MANKATYGEMGVTGLSEFSGIISDDFLREMRGREGYKRFDEMRKNSPIIGALLLANELSIRKVSWSFKDAAVEEGANSPRIELLNAARDNTSTSWNDFIVEVLTMLPFGFSLFEICYERVESAVLWRKFAPRGQDTIYKWIFDESGGIAGATQQASPRYTIIDIPVEKLLLFRTRVERGNPEGRSILRTAWIPYYYAKHIQQIEAIGIERDLAGLPHITLPEGADTSDNENSDFGKAEKLVSNVRNDEQAGIVTPAGWEFELLSTGGSRQFDTDKIVRRYESRMLMSALAQFIMLGQDNVGSLALSKDLTDFFVMAVNAVADIIAETFTKYAIPRLLALNGFDAVGISLTHTPAGDVDITAIADFLQKVKEWVTPGVEDELWIRDMVGMPTMDKAELQARRDEKERKQKEQFKQRSAAFGGNTEKDNRDDNAVTLFEMTPVNEEKRLEMEEKLKRLVTAHLAKTQKRVMKYARGVRNA